MHVQIIVCYNLRHFTSRVRVLLSNPGQNLSEGNFYLVLIALVIRLFIFFGNTISFYFILAPGSLFSFRFNLADKRKLEETFRETDRRP